MRREVGILLTVAGAGLAWLVKNRLRSRIIVERHLTLTTRNGRCEIKDPVEVVRLRWLSHDQVRWIITNPGDSGEACSGERRVCVGNWALLGAPVHAPVAAPDGGPLCRTVRSNGPTQTITAVVRLLAVPKRYKYDVLIDGDVALDPMFEIVV